MLILGSHLLNTLINRIKSMKFFLGWRGKNKVASYKYALNDYSLTDITQGITKMSEWQQSRGVHIFICHCN